MAHALYQPLLAISISGASILSGFLLGLSYVSIPVILRTPSIPEPTLLTLWRLVYFRGFHISPFLAVFSGALSLTNAYLLPTTAPEAVKSQRLVLAGLLMACVVPFTLVAISPTNRILIAREDKLVREKGHEGVKGHTVGKGEAEATMQDSRRLVKKWATLNYIRAALPLAGALVAWSAW